MFPLDKETNRPRGYFLLSSYTSQKAISLCKLSQEGFSTVVNWTSLGKTFCKDIPERLITERPKTLEEVARVVLNDPFIMSLQNSMQTNVDKSENDPEYGEQYLSSLLNAINMSPLHSIVQSVFEKQLPSQNQLNNNQIAFVSLFLLSFPMNLFTNLSPELMIELQQYRDRTNMSPILKHEVEKIDEEVTDLIENFCTCSKTKAALSNNSINLDGSETDIVCCQDKIKINQ